MGWTSEQQAVIDARGVDLLVSAAAGSGKTAVLVERIISMILDENNPIDIDEILVVTFTNAAAAEMKDRVRIAIEKALEQNPGSAHLRRQATLVHGAQIRTIDSFCSYLVRNYFYKLGVEPGFRIGAKSELSILCDEVLDEILEERLSPENKDFRILSDAYTSKNRLDKLKELIKDLAKKGASSPWPNEWYDSCLRLYSFDTVEELNDSEIMKAVMEQVMMKLHDIVDSMTLARDSYGFDYSSKDATIICRELSFYQELVQEQDFQGLYERILAMPDDFYVRWSKSKSDLLEEQVKENQAIRTDAKKAFGELKDEFFAQPLESILADALHVRAQLRQLVDVTKEYQARVDQLKASDNIYDFNDIEHMALSILRNPMTTEHERTDVAMELSRHFKEVMVDEYQDSNYLQEAILTAVCASDEGRHDYFMVGDVKQSIYAFRQANPNLFIKKFNDFVDPSATDNRRIDLGKNFRSRKEVLEFCNDICYSLMKADVGGVQYDEAAALVPGSDAYDKVAGPEYEPEILIIEEDKETMKSLGIRSKTHLEAKLVATRINQLISSKLQVLDKATGSFRDVCYSDIVILMRGLSSKSDAYIEVLRGSGIPAIVESETGFFDREEVVSLLSLLEIIDNPHNDIPLAAVALSPIFNINNSLLAAIRMECPAKYLYQSMRLYYEAHKDVEALEDFFEFTGQLKELAVDTPVHELLLMVLEQREYLAHVKSLPSGEFKAGNVLKLMDEAVKFESGVLVSLSDFVKYINDQRTYDEDPGLAKQLGDNANAVRLMTIHKSKGLEFPVVFLSSTATAFNSDKGDLLYHDRFGLGLKYVNADRRIEYKTPISNQIKNQIRQDQLGEEQRVLYVALTRAKEKMIVTSVMEPTKDESLEDKVGRLMSTTSPLSKSFKLDQRDYISWILAALSDKRFKYPPQILQIADLIESEVNNQLNKEVNKEQLLGLIGQGDKHLIEKLEADINFAYKHATETVYKNKYSVSELKHRAMEEAYDSNEEMERAEFLPKEKESYVPMFMRNVEMEIGQKEEPAGAIYGTAIHRFFECFDFERDDYASSISEQLEAMKAVGAVDEEQYAMIKRCRLNSFVQSNLARRMHVAACAGKLYKEQPFVYGATPSELFEDVVANKKEQEMILVQGIIDVFFEEDGQIVLMDYKTDKVDTADELMVRYVKQLRLYEDAIKKAYGKEIKETLIYSFSLKDTIVV